MKRPPPTALITGASSGIGRELARVFAENGYGLVLVARDRGRLDALAEEIRGRHGVSVRSEVADLSDAASLESLIARISSVEIDVLVNNAGFGVEGKFFETSWAREREMLGVNVNAVVRLTKEYLPRMVNRGSGRILQVSSTAAFQPGPYLALYFASKSFILSFSEAIAEEVRGTGVSVTALCPGLTRTGFERRLGTDSRLFSSGIPVADPVKVARHAYASLMRGKRMAIHGWFNRFLFVLEWVLPRSWTLRILAWAIGRNRSSRPTQSEDFPAPKPLVSSEPRDGT